MNKNLRKSKGERKQCLFCDNYANSKEDTFPLWLLQIIGKHDDMVKAINGLPTKIQKGSAVLRIRTVCESCNGGWMSQLEQSTIPVLRPLLQLHDLSIPIPRDDQILLATWVMKTGMVLDSIYKHAHFYLPRERKNLRENRTLPAGTVIWIGRFFGNGKHAGLSNFDVNGLVVGNGCILTFIFGPVVFQILSIRPAPQYDKWWLKVAFQYGRWNELLAQIWPNAGAQITWPPLRPFTLYGTFPVGSLVNRFKPRPVSV